MQTSLVSSCIVARAYHPSRIHKFALDVRGKTLGSRSLLLLNLISHNLPPLKSSASTKRRLTTPESTVEPESTNDSYRVNSDAPMPPGLTLSVFLCSIRKLGSTVPCLNRKQRSMRPDPPDFTLRSAPVVTQHATKTSWCTATREPSQGSVEAIPQSLKPHERQLIWFALWGTVFIEIYG